MTERTNVPVLKTGVGLPTVGSNPTPSAKKFCLGDSPHEAADLLPFRAQRHRNLWADRARVTFVQLIRSKRIAETASCSQQLAPTSPSIW